MSLISEIENDLKALLKIEMEDAMTKLDFVACDKVCDIDLNNPVLILCVCVSRLGTDATNAIQALKCRLTNFLNFNYIFVHITSEY